MCNSYLTLLFDVGGSCRSLYSIVSYLYVGCSVSISSVGKKELIVCYRLLAIMWFLFGEVVLGMGCVILLLLSLGLPYNYFKAVLPHGSLCCMILTSVSVLPSPFVCTDGINFGYGR